jgi:hypothetical protein
VKSLLRRRPSPAMIVALIALFVSLSGVSYGVATGFIDSREILNNQVRSIDIRNNEVRTRDLRNNEVRGIDIRNSTVQSRDIALNAVTGDDVKEDTLQKVPSALLADTATSATSATTAGSVSTLRIIPVRTVPGGTGTEDPTVLATHGPLTLLGECGAGAGTARLLVDTSEDNSAAGGNGTGSSQDPDVDADDDPVEIAEAGGMSVQVYAPFNVSALAPSGKAFSGEVAIYRNQTAGTCRFHGHLALQG